jgi:hypothetical protein
MVDECGLDSMCCFSFGLALLASFDSAAGPVIATCQNDANRTLPTVALVQKLWDQPDEALALADPTHPLFRYGLLRRAEANAPDWDAALHTPELVARKLLFPDTTRAPQLEPVADNARTFDQLEDAAYQTALLLRAPAQNLRIVTLLSRAESSATSLVSGIAPRTGRRVLVLRGSVAPQALATAMTLCWLEGCDLMLPAGTVSGKLADALLPSLALPITVFVEVHDRGTLDGLPPRRVFTTVDTPAMTYTERVAQWTSALGAQGGLPDGVIAEVARRFRYAGETINQIGEALKMSPEPITHRAITAACRSAARAELGDLAQRVNPRFDKATELFLPQRHWEHFNEVLQAMRSLTEVHYRWGTARVWNEGGIAVLFSGPPGTGKTMAAEILASELDLPMYRVDLSQVVNKYIGETEKNLKRIFDAADVSDTLLLFDEADSIFGKRVEARDAHDRYANLEISYLLERMERFKGLAVLATNRKKDLDDAFLRRLRYVIDFPLPGPEQRRRIWERSIPAGVDASALDLELLASRFPMSGGHIRSVLFNACLQSAKGNGRAELKMEPVLVALKRELDKIHRPVALDLFGEYAPIIERMEREANYPN